MIADASPGINGFGENYMGEDDCGGYKKDYADGGRDNGGDGDDRPAFRPDGRIAEHGTLGRF